jgi:hypothetical protein
MEIGVLFVIVGIAVALLVSWGLGVLFVLIGAGLLLWEWSRGRRR